MDETLYEKVLAIGNDLLLECGDIENVVALHMIAVLVARNILMIEEAEKMITKLSKSKF